jgi:hypothetical protein
MKHGLLASAVCAALGFAGSAHAVLVTGSGTVGGNSVAASADFEISGNTLTITMKNTSVANGMETPTNTLTGIEFTFQNTKLALTPVSAISPNAIVDAAACDVNPCGGTNVNVGGEWGLDNGTTAGLTGVDAIASAGYITTGISGNLGNFNGLNLQSPVSLDGINFGILSNTHGTLNGGLTGRALLEDTVVIKLAGVGNDLANPGNLTGVTFLYGTSLGEGSIAGSCSGGSCLIIPGGGGAAPEPATLGIFGTALLGLAAAKRRKRSS